MGTFMEYSDGLSDQVIEEKEMKTITDEKIIEWLEENDRPVYTYSELEDLFEETLNDIYDDVKIEGLTFSAGQIVRNLDPVAFRCGVSDWWPEEFGEIGDVYTRKDEYDDAVEALNEEESED